MTQQLSCVPMLVACAFFSVVNSSVAREPNPENRWEITPDGGILWNIAPNEAHQDFYQMAGEQLDVVVRYAVGKDGDFTVTHDVNWPMLRFEPKTTGGHWLVKFGQDLFPPVNVLRGEEWHATQTQTLRRVRLNGVARFEGTYNVGSIYDARPLLDFKRAIYPSVTEPAVFDTTVLTNNTKAVLRIAIDSIERSVQTDPSRGTYGGYRAVARVVGGGVHELQPGESITFTMILEAHRRDETWPALDAAQQLKAREARIAELQQKLRLETPNPVLNATFAFAKIRATECIYRTKGGLLHGPSDGRKYYAAVWANDSAEYTPPFFAMLGDPTATEAAANAFRHFARFINPDYKAIPSSIVAEGDAIWHGAGDRGDMAMLAYGAGRFALANGDKAEAEKLWPLIEWSLEYLRRKVTQDGVIASDSDELENRFPAGKANLSTSALAYDALRSAAWLGRDLGKSRKQIQGYERWSVELRAAIEKYFGADVRGFSTYRYYDKADLVGHRRFAKYATQQDVLRAWIAIPLTVDIFDRKQGTIDALFSSKLWTADGLASEEGQETFWDRATLYGLRGVLAAGDTRRGLDYLQKYSHRRLLGDHVPYAIEAWPEGGMAQLSAESALYARVFTEGLFGMRPTGLRSFALTPRLPDGWPSMALRRIHAFGGVFDLRVTRDRGRLNIQIHQDGQRAKLHTVEPGATINVTLR